MVAAGAAQNDHDLAEAQEAFFVLVADHYHVTLPKAFENYPDSLARHVPRDGGLISVQAIKRLNKVRVMLKHHSGHPSPQTIEQAVADTRTFLTANTELVFSIDYQTISMVQVINHTVVRRLAEAGEEAAAEGNYVRAMMKLRLAFDDLFTEHEPRDYGRASEFAFGPPIGPFTLDKDAITRALSGGDGARRHGHDLRRLGEQISDVTEAVQGLQLAMRLSVLGVDYPSYLRFSNLTPRYQEMWGGGRSWRAPVGYSPGREEFDFCLQFIVTASLRLSAAETQITDPPWVSRNQWGQVKWEDLPDEQPDRGDDSSETNSS